MNNSNKITETNWVLVQHADLAEEATIFDDVSTDLDKGCVENEEAESDIESDGISIISEGSNRHEVTSEEELDCAKPQITSESDKTPESQKNNWTFVKSEPISDKFPANQFFLNCSEEPVQELEPSQTDEESDGVSITSESELFHDIVADNKNAVNEHVQGFKTAKKEIQKVSLISRLPYIKNYNSGIAIGSVLIATTSIYLAYYFAVANEVTDLPVEMFVDNVRDSLQSNIDKFNPTEVINDKFFNSLKRGNSFVNKQGNDYLTDNNFPTNQRKKPKKDVKQNDNDKRKKKSKKQGFIERTIKEEYLKAQNRYLEKKERFLKKKEHKLQKYEKKVERVVKKINMLYDRIKLNKNEYEGLKNRKNDEGKNFEWKKFGKEEQKQNFANKKFKIRNDENNSKDSFENVETCKNKTCKYKENFKDKVNSKKQSKYENAKNKTQITSKESKNKQNFNQGQDKFKQGKFLKLRKNLTESKNGTWEELRYKTRNNIRKKQHSAEWYFDRTSYRTSKRDHARWYFEMMNDRELLRYKKANVFK